MEPGMPPDAPGPHEPPLRYGALAQAFHWAIAALVLAAFLLGPEGPRTPALQRQWHETIGMTVLLLSVARLAWLMGDPRPEPPAMPRWIALFATAVQGLLYVALFAVPLTAIAGTWLEGHPLTLLGGVRIEPWIEPDRALGHDISELHGWLGNAMLWLAGLHAVAALVHHFVLRDRVLLSMLPGRRQDPNARP